MQRHAVALLNNLGMSRHLESASGAPMLLMMLPFLSSQAVRSAIPLRHAQMFEPDPRWPPRSRFAFRAARVRELAHCLSRRLRRIGDPVYVVVE